MLGRRRGDRVRVEPVVVARDRHRHGAGERERLQRRQVGRLLDEHAVAGLQQHGGGERERLLGAARDEHVVGLGRQAARGQPRGDRGAQLGSPSVVEYCSARPARAPDSAAANAARKPGRVEQLRRGQAAGERDHARPGGQGEDLAHRRARDAAQAGGDRG